MEAIVKAVKTGNWTIEVYKYVDPKKYGFGGNYSHPVYVAISEDSAAWGITPPWYKGGGVEVPVKRRIFNDNERRLKIAVAKSR